MMLIDEILVDEDEDEILLEIFLKLFICNWRFVKFMFGLISGN